MNLSAPTMPVFIIAVVLAEPVPDSRNLGFIQKAGRLFAVARDKRHGGAVAKQSGSGSSLLNFYMQLLNCNHGNILY